MYLPNTELFRASSAESHGNATSSSEVGARRRNAVASTFRWGVVAAVSALSVKYTTLSVALLHCLCPRALSFALTRLHLDRSTVERLRRNLRRSTCNTTERAIRAILHTSFRARPSVSITGSAQSTLSADGEVTPVRADADDDAERATTVCLLSDVCD